MKTSLRIAFSVCALYCASTFLAPTEAFARTHHHATHHKHSNATCTKTVTKHGHRHHIKVACGKSSASMSISGAQTHLINLGYYHGVADGKLGPKTTAAIKAFQREHGLKADGKLGRNTIAALNAADKTNAMGALPIPSSKLLDMGAADFYAAHPDFYGHVDQQYSDPMQQARQGGVEPLTQGVASRYAKLDVSEVSDGASKRYNVTMNGQTLLMVNDQPSVIGISRTYDLGNEDAIIFSAFNPYDSVCSFKHYLLTLREGSTVMHPIDNCTRGYQASIKENSLFIVFPETDDGRLVGATWRYEAGDLERL